MSTFIFLAALFLINPAPEARADELYLTPGQSQYVNGTLVNCGLSAPAQLTVIARECDEEDAFGNCRHFNERTVSGRYCITGNVCGKSDPFGRCIYFNTDAECGDTTCSKTTDCGHMNVNGLCDYFNESISCW